MSLFSVLDHRGYGILEGGRGLVLTADAHHSFHLILSVKGEGCAPMPPRSAYGGQLALSLGLS